MGGVSRYVPRFIPLDPEEQALRIAGLLAQARCDPGSVPYSVVDLEAVALLLEGMTDDPDAAARDNYLLWLELRAREHGGAWAVAVALPDDVLPAGDDAERIAWQWIRHHATAPFPVGQSCPDVGDGFPAAALRDLLPLDGDERAFAVEPQGERGGALLFMGKPGSRRFLDGAGWIAREPAWRPDGARVETVPVPQRSIRKATQQEARRWWREVNGLPVKGGRHPGAAIWTTEKIMDALLAYVQTHGGETPSRETLVKWAYQRDGMVLTEGSEKVIGDRWNRLLGMSFPDVRDSIAHGTTDIWTLEGEPG